jgi:general secretion pathway protein E
LPGIYGRLLGAELLPARFAATWEPPAGIEALPVDFLLARGWLPVAREDERWVFAAHAPLDLEVNEWLGGLAEPYVLRLVSEEQFDVLKARLGRRQDAAAESSLSSVEEGRLRELASEAPTVNLLNTLIARALKQGASDMHIEPQGSRARVRFRIDGVLHEVDVIAPAMVLPVITRLKILAGMDIGERRRPQDGKIDLRMAGEELDIRVSALPVTDGESAVLRFLRKGALLYDMTLLGLSADVEARVLEDIEVTAGVVLLTGPTGSGKTTTLYTFLSRLNSPEVKIITLEDPVEYQLAGVNQVQVQPAIGFDFAAGLRSIVRQDPDIIMIGEIRDRETAAIGMQSALTGHLVFSTVHTNDAPTAYTRLLDLGVEEYLLNAALRSILAQRLARRLCPKCKAPEEIPPEALLHAGFTEADLDGTWQPFTHVGCDACRNTGYKGRVGIYEVMTISDEMRQLIMKNGSAIDIADLARREGMTDLRHSGLKKVKAGITSLEEIEAVTND